MVGFDRTNPTIFAIGFRHSELHRGLEQCAEDVAAEQLRSRGVADENIVFTSAIRPRTGEIVPVCIRCQGRFEPSNFLPGVSYVSIDKRTSEIGRFYSMPNSTHMIGVPWPQNK